MVGHSSGGTVITQAGNNPKVAALVYVDANAPDSGQSLNELLATAPTPPWAATLIKDEAGYLTLPRAVIVNNFAPELTTASQPARKTSGASFGYILIGRVEESSAEYAK